MNRQMILLLVLFGSFLLVGTTHTRPYPDGPFKVIIQLEGRAIYTNNSIEFSSSTTVNERYAGGAYTKTAGVTSYAISTITTPEPNTHLDRWYNEERTMAKDFFVWMRDGSERSLEGWLVYNVKIAGRQTNSDGSVTYKFSNPNALERDLAVAFP